MEYMRVDIGTVIQIESGFDEFVDSQNFSATRPLRVFDDFDGTTGVIADWYTHPLYERVFRVKILPELRDDIPVPARFVKIVSPNG